MLKDFLCISELTTQEILDLFAFSSDLKRKQKAGISHTYLRGKTLAMLFQKPSTRTRVSFEVGMFQLGGHAIYMSPDEVGLGERETVADVARVLSRYVDGIMARLFSHRDLIQLSEFASVPVINGLTDFSHPCQILSDMFTIAEYKGSTEGVHIAYVGDGNNVCNSWLTLAEKLPFKLTIGTPHGYEPDQKLLRNAMAAGISDIEVMHSPEEAVYGADIVYTDVWASMGQESEAMLRKKQFADFQVNENLFSHTGNEAIFLHCLPAHRGEEVAVNVIDGPRSMVFDQAENRLHVEKALLVELMGKPVFA